MKNFSTNYLKRQSLLVLAFAVMILSTMVGCQTEKKPTETPAADEKVPGIKAPNSVKFGDDALIMPVATAWFYMSDDRSYNEIPSYWDSIGFVNMDVLNIGPFGVQSGGTFGLYKSDATGPLSKRFEWVAKTARSQNPDIKILMSQWWGNGIQVPYPAGPWGSSLSALNSDDAALDAYVASVIGLIAAYQAKGIEIDGYDIDYEGGFDGTNVLPFVPTIYSKLNAGSDSLSLVLNRPLYLTASPADTTYLRGAVSSLDFINIQNYDGGMWQSLSDFTDMGYSRDQLLFGICPETNCNGYDLAYVEQMFTDSALAGIHSWRLNSGNYVYEDQIQDSVYFFLHPPE